MTHGAMIRYGAGATPRRYGWLACGMALSCFFHIGIAANQARAAAFVPASDSMVLERIPAARDAAAGSLRALQAALRADPGNLGLALRVADGDLDQARAQGDPRFLGRADAALTPWPLSPATPPEVLLRRAEMLQSTHQFAASLAALGQLLAQQPGNRQAWLVQAAVHLAQGRPDEAGRDCSRYAAMAYGLLADSCVAGVMAAQGHGGPALRALRIALNAGGQEPKAARLFALTIGAETAAALDDPQAEAWFTEALALDSTDPYLLAIWSDFLHARQRDRDIIALLAPYSRIDPLLLRLTLAERALGLAECAGHITDLGERFAAAAARGETVHRREEAIYHLDLLRDPAGALVLAQANWGVQREAADALILARAAMAAHAPEAAAPVRDWLARTGREDKRLARILGGQNG